MITLVVTLKSPTRVRASTSYDITVPRPWDDSADGPSKTRRTYAAQRKTGEHVIITLLHDGRLVDTWNGDYDWPRETIPAIQTARGEPTGVT